MMMPSPQLRLVSRVIAPAPQLVQLHRPGRALPPQLRRKQPADEGKGYPPFFYYCYHIVIYSRKKEKKNSFETGTSRLCVPLLLGVSSTYFSSEYFVVVVLCHIFLVSNRACAFLISIEILPSKSVQSARSPPVLPERFGPHEVAADPRRLSAKVPPVENTCTLCNS
jgi:hypothetical protein